MEEKKDFYQVLGIDRNATQDDIKKAFKKLSMKYHPDRVIDKSEEEKKEAEEKFKNINEAYQILSDETKRQNYDTFGTAEPRTFDPFGGFGFDDIFDPFNGGRRGRRTYTKPIQPGKDIRMQVPLTIEEIFTGCTKTLVYEKDVRCAVCHGDGGTGKKTCPVCHGTGMEVKVQHTPFGIIQHQTTCSRCNGEGTLIDKKCHTCNGTGFRREKNTVELDFPAGIYHGNGLKVVGEGSESKDRNGKSGDFIAIAVHNYDMDKYVVEGYDVIEKIYLPLYDLLLGTIYEHTFPDKRTKKINIDSCVPDGKVIRLFNDGIEGKGDYYLEIHYQLPTELSDKERKLVEDLKVLKAKEMHSK